MKNNIQNNILSTARTIESLIQEELYEDSLDVLSVYRPLDHTMGYAIDKYVQQRIPVKLVEHAIINEVPIHIHGIYPEHFAILFKQHNIANYQEFTFLPEVKAAKKFNHIRPRYFIAQNGSGNKVIYIFITSGADYIYHYASMFKHMMDLLSNSSSKLISIYRYPKLEEQIAYWTDLDNNFVHQEDIVIIGYVDEIANHLNRYTVLKQISCYNNKYYHSTRYQFGDRVINFLGVCYSYWGNISAQLAKRCCQLGASELIYIAKQGALTQPRDLYNRIFSAESYLVMNKGQIVSHITNLSNPILALFPNLNSGTHLSVPTVLEENYYQREVAQSYNIESIDNEISQIALAVDEFNKLSTQKVKFFNLHFATDYIRTIQERSLETNFDLTNNRSIRARDCKQRILEEIAGYLLQYLIHVA